MVEPVEYAVVLVIALVLPPLVVVVVLARYDPEQPKVVDQLVQYLVHATEWYC
jgi:ABC-type nitrate/sulfonate/bicarbonate transport system substrate-binding protein